MTAQETKEDLARHKKVQAEIAKLIAETSKINSENKWYPAIVSASVILVILLLLKSLSRMNC